MPKTMSEEQAKRIEAVESHPLGIGFRPSFHALWHLKEIGAVPDLLGFASEVWNETKKGEPVRVAVIDTPVAYKHPNLVGAIDLGLMRDFSIFDDGVFVVRDGLDAAANARREWLISRIADQRSDIARAIEKEMKDNRYRRQFAPTQYGTHGTAVSGLIGARPAEVKYCEPAYLGANSDPLSDHGTIKLPYCGINPFCSIVPVSVTAAPYPSMIKGALEYVRMIEAKIVVVAAAWADGMDRKRDSKGWDDVDLILEDLGKDAEVVCAAGNQATNELVYPASLSKGNPGIWAVTACGVESQALTYAPTVDEENPQMINALSSEMPRYDREVELADPWAKQDLELGPPKGDPKTYPARDIISLDIPGPSGYNPSPYNYTPSGGEDDQHYEIGSLYCRFSGTSAASAIAAGLISLAMQSDNEGGAEGMEGHTEPEIVPDKGKMLTAKSAKALLANRE